MTLVDSQIEGPNMTPGVHGKGVERRIDVVSDDALLILNRSVLAEHVAANHDLRRPLRQALFEVDEGRGRIGRDGRILPTEPLRTRESGIIAQTTRAMHDQAGTMRRRIEAGGVEGQGVKRDRR
tara:strand:+ start:474 stop:845 length:372 start_codon:yes stop_codon:yes gene_type:complete